jgi:hypothetical protein
MLGARGSGKLAPSVGSQLGEPSRQDHRRDQESVGDRLRRDECIESGVDPADCLAGEEPQDAIEAVAPGDEHEYAREDEDERRAPRQCSDEAAADPDRQRGDEHARRGPSSSFPMPYVTMARAVAEHMMGAALDWARRVTVKAIPAATAART